MDVQFIAYVAARTWPIPCRNPSASTTYSVSPLQAAEGDDYFHSESIGGASTSVCGR